jgi:hypothetical protein
MTSIILTSAFLSLLVVSPHIRPVNLLQRFDHTIPLRFQQCHQPHPLQSISSSDFVMISAALDLQSLLPSFYIKYTPYSPQTRRTSSPGPLVAYDIHYELIGEFRPESIHRYG